MKKQLSDIKVLIKGAGEIASGIAHRLHQSGLKVCLTEVPSPLAVSRGTAFSEAVFDGTKTIQKSTAVLAPVSVQEIERVWREGNIALIIDPDLTIREKLKPDVLVDAIMLKKPTGIKITDAPLVIGIGPGFIAGENVHIVVESHESNLGKLIYEGEPYTDNAVPIEVGGLRQERVVWAPVAGLFHSKHKIGDAVKAGEVVGTIYDTHIKAPITGHLRGIIRNGEVYKGCKLVEVDHVNLPAVFFEIRPKMVVIGNAVLQAITRTYSELGEDIMLDVFTELINMLQKGESGVLATIIESKGSAPRKAGAKMLIKQDGSFIGTIGGGGVEKQMMDKAAEVLKNGRPEIFHFDLSGAGREAAMICGGQVDVFLEPIQNRETLFLFGAGHISQSTAHIGKMLGFRVVIIDPRAEYNNPDRFPDADQLVVEEYQQSFTELNVEPGDYIVIYTPGHILDEECLTFALTTKARYIGMIGSRKKSQEIKKRIMEKGVPEAKISQVHSPVGLDIGAETPDEIAISILAEVIKERRAGKKT